MKITTQVAENLDPEEFIETRSLCSHSNLSSNSNTAQIIKFSMKDFFSKCEEIFNGKLYFLCSASLTKELESATKLELIEIFLI